MATRLLTAALTATFLAACSRGSSRSGPPPTETPRPAAIALGKYRTCALMDDGRVKCLGDNAEGELGVRTTDLDPHFDPTVVASVTAITSLDAAEWDTCAVGAGGVVKCWGRALYGQLGSNVPNGATNVADPVQLSTISGATAVAAGGMHTCVLVDGVARCVGVSYANGRVGTSSPDPLAIVGTEGATAISAGARYTCAIVAGGVKCWGTNDHGELGRDTHGVGGDPTADFVTSLGTVTAISAGTYHTCAVLLDTTVKCWGNNTNGELGNGAVSSYELTPVAVSGLSGAVAVAAGGVHTCALLHGGTVACWGSNACWNLGTQAGTGSSTAVAVGSISGATAIAAGAEHTCVLTAAGVKCWGCNGRGELGRNPKTEVPVDVPF